MSTPAELLAQSLAKFQTANRIDGSRASYRKDSPTEYAKVMGYLAGGARPSGVVSDIGMGLMLEEDARRALVPAPPPPPPPPTPTSNWNPPYDSAWKWDDFDPTPTPGRWLYEYLGSAPGFPNPGATSVSDDEGGRAVRLTVPAGQGGGGVLSTMYDGSAAFSDEGLEQFWRVGVRFVPGFYVPSGSYSWVFEWHEMKTSGVNSCALGVTPEMKMRVQISGGDVVGHQYTQHYDTEVLKTGLWYLWDGRIFWSTDPAKGKFDVRINGRDVIRASRATLLRQGSVVDRCIIGCYNYHLPAATDMSIDFRHFAVGPTRASIGL